MQLDQAPHIFVFVIFLGFLRTVCNTASSAAPYEHFEKILADKQNCMVCIYERFDYGIGTAPSWWRGAATEVGGAYRRSQTRPKF